MCGSLASCAPIVNRRFGKPRNPYANIVRISMSSNLLTVFAEIVAKPGKEEDVRRHLLDFVQPTRQEKGCVQYDLHVSEDEPGRFFFYENWDSAADLDAHAESAHISAFRSIAPGLLAQPTRIVRAKRIA